MRGPDVEPVELEPIEVEDRRPPREPLRLSRVWIVGGAIAVLVWGGLALATRRDSGSPKHSRTAAAASPIVPPPAPVTLAPPRITDRLPNSFVLRMRFVVPSRFAVSTGDQLFVLQNGSSSHVPLSPGPVVIEATSGDSLLVHFGPTKAIVTTSPVVAVHPVPNDREAIPAVEPGHWWYANNRDGLLQKDDEAATRIPGGLRLLAALDGGFLAVDRAGRNFVIWDGVTIRNFMPLANNNLLGTSPHAVAFARSCSIEGCTLAVVDTSGQTRFTVRSPHVFRNAIFSGSGDQVAVIALGTASVINAYTGRTLAETSSIGPLAAGVPAGWATNSLLLVVQHYTLALVDNGRLMTPFAADGLQQVVALRSA